MSGKIIDMINPELEAKIKVEVEGMKFTKNFRSASAEEWYVFLPNYKDPISGGAVGKAFIHYDLMGNKEIFVNTTLILDDPELHKPELHPMVYALADEVVNRLVGYADTLLSVHAGENSYSAEYVE